MKKTFYFGQEWGILAPFMRETGFSQTQGAGVKKNFGEFFSGTDRVRAPDSHIFCLGISTHHRSLP